MCLLFAIENHFFFVLRGLAILHVHPGVRHLIAMVVGMHMHTRPPTNQHKGDLVAVATVSDDGVVEGVLQTFQRLGGQQALRSQKMTKSGKGVT